MKNEVWTTMVITKRLVEPKDKQNDDIFFGIYRVLLRRTVPLTMAVTRSAYTQVSICEKQLTTYPSKIYHVFMANIAYLTTANRYMVRLTGNYSDSFRKHPRLPFARSTKENIKTSFEPDFSNNLRKLMEMPICCHFFEFLLKE